MKNISSYTKIIASSFLIGEGNEINNFNETMEVKFGNCVTSVK